MTPVARHPRNDGGVRFASRQRATGNRRLTTDD
jgi:hypothetical protein